MPEPEHEPSPDDLKALLLTAHATGAFLEVVEANAHHREQMRDALIAIHDEGSIDVVAAFAGLENDGAAGPRFFMIRHAFEDALPHIQAPALDVIRCVQSLWRRAGNDGASGLIVARFLEFSRQSVDRSREALAAIEAHPDELMDMLPTVIAAGSSQAFDEFVGHTLRLCASDNIEVRQRAVFALGTITWRGDSAVPEAVVETLESAVAAGNDDVLMRGVLNAAGAVFPHGRSVQARLIEVIKRALANGGGETLEMAARLLHSEELVSDPRVLAILVEHLQRVDASHNGTVSQIDLGVSRLLETPNADSAIGLLEGLLTRAPSPLPGDAFRFAFPTILNNPNLLRATVVKWFLSGKRSLCNAAAELIASRREGLAPLEVDSTLPGLDNPTHLFFLARKVVGFLFTRAHVPAAAMLISIMRLTEDRQLLGALAELLRDPLLLNYPKSIGELLEARATTESEAIAVELRGALTELREYFDALQSVGRPAALRPPEAHRETFRRYMSAITRTQMREAEKRSVLLSIVTKQVLLYGRKSIDYIEGPGGHQRRMETPLAAHHVEIEVARMTDVDPTGLNYQLRVFRAEQLRDE